jgi:hypothetical protein
MAGTLFPAELYKLVEEDHGFTEDPAAEAWLQSYMAKIRQVIESGRHLVMIGAPGCGKSFACARLARSRGPVCYRSSYAIIVIAGAGSSTSTGPACM